MFFCDCKDLKQRSATYIVPVWGWAAGVRQFEGNQPEMTYIVPVWEWVAGVYFLQVEVEGVLLRAEKFVVVR